MSNCEIRSYIKKLPVSQTEQARLNDLHNEIGKDALKSKAFRKFNDKLYTRKYTYDKAMHFIASINKKYNSAVAKLAQISPNQHILKVNVSSLSKEIQGKLFASTDNEFPKLEDIVKLNEVDYQLKSIIILTSPKADEIFRKGDKNNWSLDKILNELQIPKEQQELIKQIQENLINQQFLKLEKQCN